MKKKSYFQGTADPNEKRKPDEFPTDRIEMDARHPHTYTWYTNHDYTADPDPNETGIGGGLYHGPMDRFKSVKDFLENRRSKMKKRREKAEKRSALLASLVKAG